MSEQASNQTNRRNRVATAVEDEESARADGGGGRTRRKVILQVFICLRFVAPFSSSAAIRSIRSSSAAAK